MKQILAVAISVMILVSQSVAQDQSSQPTQAQIDASHKEALLIPRFADLQVPKGKLPIRDPKTGAWTTLVLPANASEKDLRDTLKAQEAAVAENKKQAAIRTSIANSQAAEKAKLDKLRAQIDHLKNPPQKQESRGFFKSFFQDNKLLSGLGLIGGGLILGALIGGPVGAVVGASLGGAVWLGGVFLTRDKTAS
jgi:hypothetical protein